MSEKASIALARAIEAHKGGRLAEAEVSYRRVLRQRPNDGDALNFLGMLRFHRGDAPSARELLRKAVEALPGNPHAWINFGNVLLISDEDAAAKNAFIRATELAPDLPVAWYNLAICLRRSKASREAATCFHKVLQLEPGYAPAYHALGQELYSLGDFAQAAEVYGEWLKHHPDDPIARHMLVAMTGQSAPARAENAYIVATFERFADHFDENLQALGYRAPQLLAERLAVLAGDRRELDVLDAGCGTGLCAPLLRPWARRLAGVDLSPAMVEKARARGGYDELAVGELCTFMRSHPGRFDAVISADTLCYFGALEEPLAAAGGCLRTGGTLAFTLERLDAPDLPYRLEPHGRYSHSEPYVRRALAGAGYDDITVRQGVLRRERGTEVGGLVVSATSLPSGRVSRDR